MLRVPCKLIGTQAATGIREGETLLSCPAWVLCYMLEFVEFTAQLGHYVCTGPHKVRPVIPTKLSLSATTMALSALLCPEKVQPWQTTPPQGFCALSVTSNAGPNLTHFTNHSSGQGEAGVDASPDLFVEACCDDTVWLQTHQRSSECT